LIFSNSFSNEVDCKISFLSNLKFDKYEITELDCGLRVVSEYIPYFRSISLGIWVGLGSRCENSNINGITHLIEHLLFKGTKKRSYKDIAIAFDSVGAEFNAFTDKENTCVYADFIDTHLQQCLELLVDIVLNPSFLPENIKTEKKIIFEEIKMSKDNPSDNVFNHFYKVILNRHPLSLPVLGSRKSLSSISNFTIWDFYKKFMLSNIVISAAGNIKHKDLVNAVKENIYGAENKNKKYCNYYNIKEPESRSIKKIYTSKTKAAHICYGGLGCRRDSVDKYPLSIFTNILGGSMSSRLFQKVREEKGLSYSIFANDIEYIDTGVVVVYAAASMNNVYRVVEFIENEIKDIKKNGIKDIELSRAKENIKGSIVLNIENISSRMSRLGKGLLLDNKIMLINQILTQIDNVGLDELNKIVWKYFEPEKMSLVILRDVNKGRAK